MCSIFNGKRSAEHKPAALIRWQTISSLLFIFFFSFSSLYAETDASVRSVQLSAVEQAWLRSHPTVYVGGLADLPPFNFTDEAGNYDGIVSDYLHLIEKKTGLHFSVEINDWSIILEKLKDKKIDVVGGAFFTAERAQFVSYSSAFFEALDYFFIRKDVDTSLYSGLAGMRVAMPEGFAHGDIIKKNFPEVEIIEVKDFGEAIDAVLENRAELLFNAYATLSYTLNKEGVSDIVPFKSVREKLPTSKFHIISRNDSPELASIIQRGLDAITLSEKRSIHEKWLGVNRDGLFEKTVKLTNEEQQWLLQHKIIRVANELDWPPYDFNVNGNPKGYSIDLITLAAKKVGVKLEFVSQHSWSELFVMAQQGRIDVLPALWKTPEREAYFNFSRPYYSPSSVMAVRDNSALYSSSELDAHVVAGVKGFAVIDVVHKSFPNVKVLQFDNISQALRSVSIGQSDAYIGSLGAVSYGIKENSISNLRLMIETELQASNLEADLYMATPLSQSLLLGVLQKGIDAITQEEKTA